MNGNLENPWLRAVLLLGALAAGAMATQFIPSYEEIAARRIEPAKPASASATRYNVSDDVTGIDVDHRQLQVVASMV